MKKIWFSAKCVFRHRASESRRQLFEERVVLLQAKDLDAALRKAEKNAAKYCREVGDCEPAGFIDIFELYDSKIGDKTEVFSTMQSNELSPEDYLNHFYPDTPEDCEILGLTHRWYKKDDKNSACYHCQVTQTQS